MRKVYMVCAHTYIDGGAPGYFIVCACSTKETATMYKDKLNEILKDPHNADALCECWYNKFLFGYNEGFACDSKGCRELFIEEVELVEEVFPNINEGFKYFEEAHDRMREIEARKEERRLEDRKKREEAEKQQMIREKETEERANKAFELAKKNACENLEDIPEEWNE